MAEDGPIPPCYNMTEMLTPSYPPRTRRNIEESDGTVIFTEGVIEVESGCALTLRLCQKFQKPYMAVDLARAPLEDVAQMLKVFVKDKGIKTLNVAGSRGSKAPDIYLKVRRVLELAFAG